MVGQCNRTVKGTVNTSCRCKWTKFICNHTRDKQIGLPLRGRSILSITRVITDRINLHSVQLPLLFSQQDEATISLLTSARSYLQSRGSSYIQQLQWRDMWAFVTQHVNNKNMVYAEGYQQSPSNDEWATPVRIHTTVPISEQSTVDCQWIKNDDNRRRKEFCDKFDGYEKICKCKGLHCEDWLPETRTWKWLIQLQEKSSEFHSNTSSSLVTVNLISDWQNWTDCCNSCCWLQFFKFCCIH